MTAYAKLQVHVYTVQDDIPVCTNFSSFVFVYSVVLNRGAATQLLQSSHSFATLHHYKISAGFGGNADSIKLPVGGAHTKLRMDSMEKIFCSQGLASPIEAPGVQALQACL